QLARCFRDGEVGRRHNIEFTMLEWYRPGLTLDALIEETAELVRRVLGRESGDDPVPLRRRRYRELFREALGIDPFTVPIEML
ncbi:amino acid--tRNA ligase-related protein, partial [Klebsiella pneumoniae]|uniref:amino acid--tRNA ligase-related protein n=1 Tax=Klebsiella pneumoniae TaxID=573 RepID=UPI002730C03C